MVAYATDSVIVRDMQLRSAPPASRPDPIDGMDGEFARMDVLQSLGTLLVSRLTRQKFEAKEEALIDEAERQLFEEMTHPARMRRQSAANALADSVASAQAAASSTIEAAKEQSLHDQDLPADPQAETLGLVSLALTSRILSQRPINSPHARAECDLLT